MSSHWLIANHTRKEFINPGIFCGSEYIWYWLTSPLVFFAITILTTTKEDLEIDFLIGDSEFNNYLGLWHGNVCSNVSSLGKLSGGTELNEYAHEYKDKLDSADPANDYEITIELYRDISGEVLKLIQSLSDAQDLLRPEVIIDLQTRLANLEDNN